MKHDTYQRLLQFLTRLDEAHIAFNLDRIRDEAILVTVAVPGEHWEIEFMHDGTVEVERFVSTGEIGDESALQDLFAVHAS